MGCCLGTLSSAEPKEALHSRKRRQTEEIAPYQTDKELIALLNDQNPFAFASGRMGRDTDQDHQKKTVLKETKGGESGFVGIGFVCRNGKKDGANQDNFCVLKIGSVADLPGAVTSVDSPSTDSGDMSVIVVCDGHGARGEVISEISKDRLVLEVSRAMLQRMDVPTALSGSFLLATENVREEALRRGCDPRFSGSTGTVVVRKNGHLTTGWVGDSRAVLGRRVARSLGARTMMSPVPLSSEINPSPSSSSRKLLHNIDSEIAALKGQFTAIELSIDHSAERQDEAERIFRFGGIVLKLPSDAHSRVFASENASLPGLAMTRSIGDFCGEPVGITSVPELTIQEISENDMFVLVCSDGVWEFITSEEAVLICARYGRDRAQKAAEELAIEAWKRWVKLDGNSVDDITVVLYWL